MHKLVHLLVNLKEQNFKREIERNRQDLDFRGFDRLNYRACQKVHILTTWKNNKNIFKIGASKNVKTQKNVFAKNLALQG